MSEKTKNKITVCLTAFLLGGLCLWALLKPADALSESERRPLASLPAVQMQTVLSGEFMQDFEDYTTDQFPLRDSFRSLKALFSRYLLGQKDTNGIYVENGYAAKLDYPLNTDSLDYAANRFQHICDKYLSEGQSVYLSVIPDKNTFLAQPNGYPAVDFNALSAYLQERLEGAQYLDLLPLLSVEDYYQTDPHWRQEQLVDVARALAAGMGVSLTGEYTPQRLDVPFYGVYCGQSGLPLPTEELWYLDSEALDACEVYNYETGKTLPVYDREKAHGKDPYELFLSGPVSLLTITNPNASTDQKLIVFRDSFASSLAPLLAEGYAEITLVDIRYLSSEVLGNLIDFTDSDVLFLYSALVLNNSVTLK